MEKSEFEKLNVGDIVRAKNSAKAFIVIDNNGKGVLTIIRTEAISNPDEWDLIFKATLTREEVGKILREMFENSKYVED